MLRLLLSTLFTAVVVRADTPPPEVITYNRDVRPILADACFRCHGFDQSQRKADRRLDTQEGATAEHDGVRAIVPGHPEQSELIRRLTTADEDDVMPPKKEARRLTDAEKEILTRWIQQGAQYEAHWAYIPPQRPAVPAVKGPARNDIDRFILARLESIGLAPAVEADPATLIRRLSFDLTGLPPRPEDARAFVSDAAPEEAWGKLVEKLLASPHFGERMAVWWLDLVRYADTIGYHSDNPRNVWPYRDWVIRQFNENTPFDRFTLLQLAGDLVPQANRDTRVASAYNRLILSTEEGGAQAGQYEAKHVTDRVKSIGTTWLGQTFMCAECHDHKFDPIATRDFYALGAFFSDIKEASIGRREDGLLLATDGEMKKLANMDARIKVLQPKGEKDPELVAAKKKREDYEKSLPHCLVSESSSQRRTVRVLPRGDWQHTGGEVTMPATPKFLPARIEWKDGQPLSRLDLARWLTTKENPLTARVLVNRLWKLLHGTGLSKTLEDMGTQGEVPVHQALLDWLACECIESGWNLKHMVRLMVNCRTYRLTSVPSADQARRDPFNREHARGARWRLEAEFVRDNALSIAGLLVHQVGGPSVKPYQPPGYWENLNFPPREWKTDGAPDKNRRGLYTWWQRSYVHPAMLAFDAPAREECTAERLRSNIPQQALVLLNDPQFTEAARAFAARIVKEGGAGPDERIRWAWEQAVGRQPLNEEVQTVRALYEKHRIAPGPGPGPGTEEGAWISVARTILNLHETITRP